MTKTAITHAARRYLTASAGAERSQACAELVDMIAGRLSPTGRQLYITPSGRQAKPLRKVAAMWAAGA